MDRLLSVAGALALACVAAQAHAWQYTIVGGPSFQQGLAPGAALVADTDGDVCLLSNDRDFANLGFAHVYGFHAADGAPTPLHGSLGGRELATFGIDCRFGDPIVGYSAYGDYEARRWSRLAGFLPSPGSLGPDFPLQSYAAIEPVRLGVDAARHAVILRDKIGGGSIDLQAYDLSTLSPLWQTSIATMPLSYPRVRDMQVAADGSITLIGTADDTNTPTMGVFLLRYDAAGQSSGPGFQFGDPAYGQVADLALSPGGIGYVVRRDREFMRDELLRLDAQAPWGVPLDIGCCGTRMVHALAALPDDGALAVSNDVFGWASSLSRFRADGSLLWRADAVPVDMPGMQVIGLVGDRAGRALAIYTEPAPYGPPQALRTVRLRAYSQTGTELWTRTIDNVRFDGGSPLRSAVSSDDVAVLAFEIYDVNAGASGILVQGFSLDQPLP